MRNFAGTLERNYFSWKSHSALVYYFRSTYLNFDDTVKVQVDLVSSLRIVNSENGVEPSYATPWLTQKPRPQNQCQQQASGKSANMRPPGNVFARFGRKHMEHLKQKPTT